MKNILFGTLSSSLSPFVNPKKHQYRLRKQYQPPKQLVKAPSSPNYHDSELSRLN